MQSKKRIGFMLWGRAEGERDAFTDEKYKGLAEHFEQHDLAVETITYNDAFAEHARAQAVQLDGLLVWVNPIEDGKSRALLDQVLDDVIAKGVMVSSAPETIRKIGTKRVLYDTRNLPWGSDVRLYETFQVFKDDFGRSLSQTGTRVLKQFRGDGGNGVFKVTLQGGAARRIDVLHAKRGSVLESLTLEEVFEKFRIYFDGGNPLIDQAWHDNLANGVVRCYMSGTTVAGFAYQEINALYPSAGEQIQPGKRYYYTERCGLFRDLRQAMETSWLPSLSTQCALDTAVFPVIWDCDFFIHDVGAQQQQKYVLCEINVSCVSPFPESAIPHITAETRRRL